ncbi:tumor protein D54-like isoform X3 [Amphibalanus amphitrite]|uniref:tumor protein D54-like isoform X3 n=1 Tax=Amphibalanus amphitrite TaxID=1232801 RepID=UPI001C90AD07|nr:tumor protein D54-like isoform X3 [Amphibalanus amphitrite]XP_043243688.1 tumor protein D54-like isoform X3 [Amphibalanus amphitrite]XP_043243689.1 tumor protein D54-like isoform X3 [Amphibalanus amphitrite]
MTTPGSEMPSLSPSADSGVVDAFSGLTPEEQEQQRQQWKEELARLEEDILLMRETLQAKMREAQVLKQKLGITVWTEFTQDVNQSLQSVRQSQAYRRAGEAFVELHHAVTSAPIYQRTGAALKSTGEKASGLFAGLGAKISEARESAAFKTVEERMGTMVNSVKSKVSTSHSNSTQSFDEALREAEAAQQKQAAAAAAPPAGGGEKPQ